MPSFILIRPTIWPQYTNVTDTTVQKHRVNRFTNGRPKMYKWNQPMTVHGFRVYRAFLGQQAADRHQKLIQIDKKDTLF